MNRMNTNRDPESVMAAWLDEGPLDLPRETRRAILTALPSIPQRRRGLALPWRFSMSRRSRVAGVALAAAAIVIVAGVALLGAGKQPTTSPSPDLPSSSPRLLAPLGYTGAGTIEFTNHDASGADVLWTIDPSGADATLVLKGACCGLFSPDGRQLALAAPGVTLPSMTRNPSLLGVEVLDMPEARLAFVVPTGCGSCAIFDLNYEPDAWSPDGRYIAISMWSDTDPSQAGLAIADRDFSPYAWDWGPLRATGTNPDIPIGFSPDGSQLLFMRTEQTAGPTAIGSLFVLLLDDLTVRQVSPPGVTVWGNGLTQGPASWSPDGQRIAFAGRNAGGGKTSIYVVAAEPGAAAEILVEDAPGASSARFSPDGTLIAFDRSSSGPFHDLYVVAPDGSGLTNLTSTFDPGVCCGQWSPDGRAMVVAGTISDDSHNDLFVVAADRSGVWQVTTEPNVYTGFLWGAGFR